MFKKLACIAFAVGMIVVFANQASAQIQWKVTTIAGDAGQEHTYTIEDGSQFGKYRLYHYRWNGSGWTTMNIDPGPETWLTADTNGDASRTFTPTISGLWKVKVFPKTAGEEEDEFEYTVGTGSGPG